VPDLIREMTSEGILVLTLNRPERMNALTSEIQNGIRDAARDSKTDDSIRCIVLTGNGRGFCAGADVASGGPATGEPRPHRPRSQFVDRVGPDEMILALADADVPVIGAINGVAVGAGFSLALACDVRIASDQTRMGTIFIKRGLGPDEGTSYFLPRLVGLSRALEIMYRGDMMDSQTLLHFGLINQIVPHEELLEKAMEFAGMIVAGAPLAYTFTRRAILRSLDNDLRHQLEYERTNQYELFSTRDAKEGFSAFLDKRAPNFVGE